MLCWLHRILAGHPNSHQLAATLTDTSSPFKQPPSLPNPHHPLPNSPWPHPKPYPHHSKEALPTSIIQTAHTQAIFSKQPITTSLHQSNQASTCKSKTQIKSTRHIQITDKQLSLSPVPVRQYSFLWIPCLSRPPALGDSVYFHRHISNISQTLLFIYFIFN